MQLSDTIDRIRPRIVQIQAVDDAGADHRVLGTGFFVDGLRVVTANHVVEAFISLAATHPNLKVGVAMSDFAGPVLKSSAGFVNIPSVVIAVDLANDLALLEVEHFAGGDRIEVELSLELTDAEGTSSVHTARFASGGAELEGGNVRDGQQIATSGFPLAIPSLVTTAGVVASKQVMDDSTPGVLVERFLADLTVNGGNSGGPAYDAGNGAIVGVVVAHHNARAAGPIDVMYNAGLTVVVPIAPVLELLAANSVTPRLRNPARARARR